MAQRRARRPSSTELAPQTDPCAPVDSALLLRHLTALMKTLEEDLLARADASRGLTAALQATHGVEVTTERTADDYDTWRRGVVTQVAAAWVLNVVFVRVLEDRGLVDHARIAGPGAEASQRQFLELAPYLTERDYLLTVFRELSHFESTREIFDPHQNLAFRIKPSADAAKQLLAVFRIGRADAPAFRFGQSDTRFLGDLYQDLSESVRKRYALLQTPDFIESFILDRTLEPALETYGLDATTLLDPTCGSGHFLLGAFERLFDRQLLEHPNQNERDAAVKALGAVYGVDSNPYAVSIAKFRLMLAFLEKAGGLTKLAGVPALSLNVVTGDSLLQPDADEGGATNDVAARRVQKTRDWADAAFAFEETEKAQKILQRGFAAVVGNPPYITVKDSALREKYRGQYESATGKYALSAPYAQRFFQLCRPGAYTGMITANSFMKREFGKGLVERVLPKLDLHLLVNTSGAYIPGHGTPTVLMFGRGRTPERSQIRTVLAKRGEPTTPENPVEGRVWSSIAEHCDDVGFDNEYISVVDMDRAGLEKHPWSLGGGGASELKELLEERANGRLGDRVTSIGFDAIMGEDDIFFGPSGWLKRLGAKPEHIRALGTGEMVRDWGIGSGDDVLFPYDDRLTPRISESLERSLWPYQTTLSARMMFGKTTLEAGLEWFEYRHFAKGKRLAPLSITFAFVATHNHFVLDRGGKVFKQSAPIIKLPETATEDDHYALLAYLNSSTACFWMKQVFFPKSGAGQAHHPDPARNAYEFAGTGLMDLPLPHGLASLASLGRRICELANTRQYHLARAAHIQSPDAFADASELPAYFAEAWRSCDGLRRKMIHLQEEIDWKVYELFRLVGELEANANSAENGEMTRGQRPFEPVADRDSLVRKGGVLLKAADAEVETSPSTELSASQAKLIEERRALMRSNAMLGLMETYVCKRLWRDTEQNQTEKEYRCSVENTAVAQAILELAEGLVQRGSTPVALLTPLQALKFVLLAAEAYPSTAVAPLLDSAAAPYLSALRFSVAGLEKHAQWLKTWDLQRREDAGKAVGTIPVPPKYKPEDFKQSTYWALRGKLDVPKERFISYPGCESDEDKSPVYGWAGWNHLERAQALSALYQARKEEGWEAPRLLPMLVGLLELLPWLHQYHGEPDEALGGERPAEQFEAFVADELRQAGKTAQQAEREVLAWAQAGGARAGRSGRSRARRAGAADGSLAEVPRAAEHSQEPESVPAARPPRPGPIKPPRKAKSRSAPEAANDVDMPDVASTAPASSTRAAPRGSSRPPRGQAVSARGKRGGR